MDSFEFNKVAGGALSALLFMFGLPELTSMMAKKPHGDDHGASKAGYALPMPKGGEAKGGGGAAVEAFSFAKVAELIGKASADSGKDVFKACVSCHTVDKGGKNGTGPNLYGIVGRDIGKHGDFSYSPAMAGKGGKWTWEALAGYLHDPKGAIPGNKMAYAGLKDDASLADLLVYLRTLADQPAPLPAVPAAAPAGAPAAPAAKK